MVFTGGREESMKSPSKSAELSERLTNPINKIITDDSHGAIEGVEFDLRHEELDPDQWGILYFLEDVMHLPEHIQRTACPVKSFDCVNATSATVSTNLK